MEIEMEYADGGEVIHTYTVITGKECSNIFITNFYDIYFEKNIKIENKLHIRGVWHLGMDKLLVNAKDLIDYLGIPDNFVIRAEENLLPACACIVYNDKKGKFEGRFIDFQSVMTYCVSNMACVLKEQKEYRELTRKASCLMEQWFKYNYNYNDRRRCGLYNKTNERIDCERLMIK